MGQQAAYLNPRKANTMCDTTSMGVIKEFTNSCPMGVMHTEYNSMLLRSIGGHCICSFCIPNTEMRIILIYVFALEQSIDVQLSFCELRWSFYNMKG